MEIAFHCPNCLADLIYDESKKYTCCFCNTVLTGKNEVTELEGGYYVGDAWNEKVYHSFHCEECGSDFIAKPGNTNVGCPICSSTSLTDKGGMVGAMPRRAIPFAHTRQQAQEMFLDYVRNNSAVGRQLATDENKELLHKVYVPIWLFTYEILAHAKLTALLRNKANESKTLFGINGTEGIAEQLSALRSSFSRFQANRKGASKDASDQPSEHVTGGVLSWQGIPFDASGILQSNVMNMLQPYDQSKMVLLTEKVLLDTPVLAITKDPITCMQEFMERIKKWTRQMIMDAHSDSYDISYFQDKTDYPLGIGELVLFPIWYMKGEYNGREFFFAMNGQDGSVDGNVPMSKGTTKNVGITYQQYWDKTRCTALTDTHFEFNPHDPNIDLLDYSFFEKPKDSRVTAEGRTKPKGQIASDLDSLIDTSATKTAKAGTVEDAAEAMAAAAAELTASAAPKKPYSATDVEIGFSKKKEPKKKLTKEEEMERAREMTERMRAAAKEEPKGDMAAASSVPSWAKAVTPPPSMTQTSSRPARVKKASASRTSSASASNKPLWERSEEDIAASKAPKKKSDSMAARIARGDAPEEEEPAATAAAMPPLGMSPFAPGAMDEIDSLDDLDKMTLPDPTANYLKVPDKYKTPKDDGEKAFREQIAAPSSRADEAPESYEIPMPKVAPTRSSGRQVKKRIPVVEDPVDLPEIPEVPELQEFPEVAEDVPADEEMMANITFSFNKKKSPMSGVDAPPVNNSIPRRTDDQPEEKLGMAIMNSEYDDGVLPYAESHREEYADEPREIVPRQTTETENYFGSDATNRPLAYRPPAPLAQRNDDVYVEQVDPHPEEDENNRPLAQRPPAPLARATEERGPSLEYLTEHEMDSEIHQMPSLESRGRWGEMPEAKETPSWAKPQQEESDSPFRRPASASASPRGRSHMSRDELRQAGQEAARRASDAAASRPAARARTLEERRKENQAAYAFRPPVQQRPAAQEPQEEPEQDQRPAWSRPAARPGTSRPAAREEAPKKNVPIWERVPETDGPIPAWGSSAAYVDDDRPRGSLMKPKGQIIDVEKPRERTGVGLWGADPSPKEVLLPGGATLGARDEEEEPREVAPRRPASRPAAERPASRSAARPAAERPSAERPGTRAAAERPAATRPAARPAAERPAATRPAARPGRAVDVEVSAPRREAVNRSAEVTEDESAPLTFSSDRPRTYAQRRQMEEEERRRQIQSPFAKPEQRAPLRRPPLRPAEMPRDEEVERPVNKTYESTQFEDKPSVVASLDMLPEPLGEESIHHFAKDSSIPALARDKDEIQDELAQGERTARKAIRGLPEYDPDGPSPFKPNR
uniref:Zinc finger domain protein, LSD1 subclass n=1 Tax=uncultured bacterium Contig1757 TaxID=1393500 RepID=W0FR14_9BACT|nr:zinc finger domain protein, LSD1 subclass [uncultured bacterium Contig1757]